MEENPHQIPHGECARSVPTSTRPPCAIENPNSDEAVKERKKKEERRKKKNMESVSLLIGIVYYHKITGKYPFESMIEMNNFVCLMHHIKDSPTEVRRKIKKLKSKYKKLVRKYGDTMMHMSPLCQEAYELWKEIWGNTTEPSDERESRYPFLMEALLMAHNNLALTALPQSVVKQRLELVGDGLMEAWDEEWKQLQEQQVDLFRTKADMLQHQTRALIQASAPTELSPLVDDDSTDDTGADVFD